ncbi:hypothetical protein [Paenochrobactrum glaciei]|uniref:Uncharacterized protein n=1 Tax=Paenochrobactrum glaciei TaxID=486407 RepID=A0ABP3RMF3_9HYPH
MPIVKMPDGTQVRFPDDMPREQIRDMIASKFPDAAQKVQPQANRDGTYGQVPEGMVLNPATGQMEDMRSPANPNIPQGGANALGLGIGQGAGFNLLDEAAAGLTIPFGGNYDYNLARMREAERRASEEHPVAYYGGQVGGAIGTGIGLAKGGLSATNAAINSGARLPAVALASGAEGAALGAGYGFGAGEGGEGRLQGARDAGVLGFGVGFATPYAIHGASKAFQKVRSPFAASPERTAAAHFLEGEGIPLTAGQKTGSRGLRYAESELGGGRTADIMAEQGRAFTDAAMRRAGGSGLADEDSLRALQSRLSKGFEGISKRNNMTADGDLLRDMLGTLQEYNKVLPSEQKQILGGVVQDVGERIKAGGGMMSGSEYQSIRSRLTKRAFNARGSDNELADAYRGIRNALDSAMERSVSGVDAGVWKELRRQYGNSKVLMKAAKGGGEEAALGIISPARLRMAASSGNGDAYVLGNTDFSQLAKAGQAAMTPLPDSGTASRLATRGLMSLPAGMGAIAGGATGDVMTGLAGAAAGAAVPKVAGKILMSDTAQRYLANQIARSPMTAESRTLLNALFNAQGGLMAGRLATP